MQQLVIPSVKQGIYVVSDRSVISDFAYRPNHGNHVRQRHLKQFWSLNPITFYVDIDEKIALERMTSRGALNEFEKAHVVGKMSELKEAYKDVALRKAPSWHHVYNNTTIEEAWEQIENYLGNIHEIYL